MTPPSRQEAIHAGYRAFAKRVLDEGLTLTHQTAVELGTFALRDTTIAREFVKLTEYGDGQNVDVYGDPERIAGLLAAAQELRWHLDSLASMLLDLPNKQPQPSRNLLRRSVGVAVPDGSVGKPLVPPPAVWEAP